MKCGRKLENEQQEFCLECQKKFPLFLEGRAAFVYTGEIKAILYRLKYRNERWLAPALGSLMTECLGDWILKNKITVIVPIPLSKKKKRRRGYNQSELLAVVIGKTLHIPVEAGLLIRVKNTAPLKGLSKAERKKVMQHAFCITRTVSEEERILLVDDIYTTGSTVNSAVHVLQYGGAKAVYMLACAVSG